MPGKSGSGFLLLGCSRLKKGSGEVDIVEHFVG
jgi:hypothetical protein